MKPNRMGQLGGPNIMLMDVFGGCHGKGWHRMINSPGRECAIAQE